MKLTNHANKRIRQRGISSLSLDIIQQFGSYREAPGGTTKIFLGRKECQTAVQEFKRLIQLLDKTNGGTIIFADDKILTVYKA